MTCVLLRDTQGDSRAPEGHIRDTSKTHQRHIKDTSETHQRHQRHIKDTSETHQRHQRHIRDTSRLHLFALPTRLHFSAPFNTIIIIIIIYLFIFHNISYDFKLKECLLFVKIVHHILQCLHFLLFLSIFFCPPPKSMNKNNNNNNNNQTFKVIYKAIKNR